MTMETAEISSPDNVGTKRPVRALDVRVIGQGHEVVAFLKHELNKSV